MSKHIEVEISYESPDSQAVIVTINYDPRAKFWNQASETRRYESPSKLLHSVGRERAFRWAQFVAGTVEAVGGPLYSIIDYALVPPATPEINIALGATAFLSVSYVAIRGVLNAPIAQAILSEAKRSIIQRWEIINPAEG